jgi:hypothetical protein
MNNSNNHTVLYINVYQTVLTHTLFMIPAREAFWNTYYVLALNQDLLTNHATIQAQCSE